MKTIKLSMVALALLASVTFFGCNTSSQKVENAKDNVDQAKEDLDKANQEYLAEVENYKKESAEITLTNEQKIEALKAKIAHEKYENRLLLEKKLAEIERKNKEMKKRLDDFKDKGKENWDSFKAEFNHDMAELGKALNGFFTDK